MNKVAYPVGLKVKEVRLMTELELGMEDWEEGYSDFPVAIIFEDGSKIYASSDPEGNGPGCLFGVTKGGEQIIVSPLTQAMLDEGNSN